VTDYGAGKSWHDTERYHPADEHNGGWKLHLVYVEVGTTGGEPQIDPAHWNRPPGVSLTVLRRSPGSPRPRRGRLLAAALSAWADEWLPDGACPCAEPFALWVGCAASPDVESLCRGLSSRFDTAPVHLHRPDR
jgi:hypothetical protein